VVRVGADGSVRVQWANPALRDLLGLPRDEVGTLLAGVLDGTGGRLTAAARDLVRFGADEIDVQVALRRPVAPREVALRLLADRPQGLFRLLPRRRGVTAALHASAVSDPAGPLSAPADGRALLADRLGAALPRLRRGSVRLVLAAASIWWPREDGAVEPDSSETAVLAERVRQAARDTDTVVAVAPGRLVVLAEDPTTGGELVLGRRVLDLLRRSAGGAEPPPTVRVSVLEVTDPDADPDAVVEHLRADGGGVADGGLTVLPPWARPTGSDVASGLDAPSGLDATDGGGVAEQVERAVRSGRFVLDARVLRPLSGPAVGAAPATVVEVVTVDEDVRTPVEVTAPLLAAALDGWSLNAVDGLLPATAHVVLRLQPGGLLTGDLGERAAALVARRPRTRLVLQVPESRLEEAVSAQRAALRDFPLLGVGLGVSAWSGAIDVRTLVRWRIEVVQLAQACQQAVLEPHGRALVAGLVAGLRAGLGPAALVVAEEPLSSAVADALSDCGVRWSDAASR